MPLFWSNLSFVFREKWFFPTHDGRLNVGRLRIPLNGTGDGQSDVDSPWKQVAWLGEGHTISSRELLVPFESVKSNSSSIGLMIGCQIEYYS